MSPKIRTNSYWAYGLNVASEIPLDDLLPSDETGVDVQVRYAPLPDSFIKERLKEPKVFERPGRKVLVTSSAICVDWEQVGRFFVHAGHEVLVDPVVNAIEEDLQPFITGPVFAFLLQQRNLFVLHSSAVSIDGSAAVFLGSKGDGKSTLAAHLQVRGHQLISDDVVPVSFDGGKVITYPGFPRVKLFGDTILAVGDDPDRFPLIHRFVNKRSFRCSDNFSRSPVEIGGIYVLAEASKVQLTPIAPSSRFIELTKHSFLNRFLNAMNGQREHFQHCDQLVRSVPVMKLGRPHEYSSMDEVCTLLETQSFRFSKTFI